MTPITGNSYVSAGYNEQMTNATAGGTWSSADTSIASVDSSTGLVTGVRVGNTTITYTLPSTDSVTYPINVVAVQVSNGFNVARLFNTYIGRMGWEQPTKSGLPQLDQANMSSISGRNWTEGHELVTINNIYNTQEDEDITAVEFNNLLRSMDKTTIMRCVNGVFNLPALIEHRICYSRTMYQQPRIIPHTAGFGSFCGYRIIVGQGDYAVVFNAISLYFNGAATFNLYLFNDVVSAPLKTQSVTTVANSQTKINLDWVINYIAQNNNGGVFYIGYFDTDLPTNVSAIDEQLILWEGSNIWGGTPFQSNRLGEGTLSFNTNTGGYLFNSFGLNVEMSAYRDYTQVIVQNHHLNDEARILCFADLVLSQIKNTTRSDDTQRALEPKSDLITADQNLAFPTKDFPFVQGLKARLTRELKRVSENFKPKRDVQTYTVGGGCYGNMNYEGIPVRDLPTRQY